MMRSESTGRQVLPIPDRGNDALVTYDAKAPGTSFPPIEPLLPPAGAPNVLMAARLDQFGGRDSYDHYAVGWAHAMCSPLQWTMQVASHWGGTRNGTIVHWPNGIAAKAELRVPGFRRCDQRSWAHRSDHFPVRG